MIGLLSVTVISYFTVSGAPFGLEVAIAADGLAEPTTLTWIALVAAAVTAVAMSKPVRSVAHELDYADGLRGDTGLGAPPSGSARGDDYGDDRGRRDDGYGGPGAALEEDPDAALEDDPDAVSHPPVGAGADSGRLYRST